MSAITVETMKPSLLSIDTARERLAATEPLSAYTFSVGDQVRFLIDPGWNHALHSKLGGDPVDARIVLGTNGAAQEIPLTKDAFVQAAAACGVRDPYFSRYPAELLEEILNHWFRDGLNDRRGTKDFQLLTAAGVGAAVTRASVVPFSNLRLLDEVLAGIGERYGTDTERLADYKFTHNLRRTHLRVIIPGHVRGIADDVWSVGISLRNSLTGEDKTSLDGYLFCWTCTNGQTDTRASSGVWSRRGGGTEDVVYAWARDAVDGILGGLGPALDAVQGLTEIPIEGEAHEVLTDLFSYYKVPAAERTKIINNMVEADTLTMYSVMAAITQVANDPDLDPGRVDSLMRMGGDLVHAAAERCTACRRLQPHP